MMSIDMSRRISNRFKSEMRPIYYAIIDQFTAPAPTPTAALENETTSRPSDAPSAIHNATRAQPSAQVSPVPSPTPAPAKKKDVRKYAHFVEFAALGLLAALFALTFGKPNIQRIVNTFSFGLAVAVTDESIQILSGRGPMVKDILLDFAGYAAGVGVIAFFCALHRFAGGSKST